METVPQFRTGRGRGTNVGGVIEGGHRQARNKQWVADHVAARSTNVTPNNLDGERWERGGHRGGRGRGRGAARGGHRFPNATLTRAQRPGTPNTDHGTEETAVVEDVVADPDPETPEEREKFYQELVKAREVERRKAIAEGKMDDPLIPKRLEDAITMVGTCMDMCPRFERYRRERENNLFEWETIPGTKRVDHRRAVKMYERAAGDKTLPSDLRPPIVLKRTLDYLFHDLLPRGGFSQTFNFIRDRSRAVRNDFTMQHETGALAMECHDRCVRFHILALHFKRNQPGFSVALEEQQLMNTLQSLKEFYEDQRDRYQSPNELEMRVYHRLIHIRDQKERHEFIPPHIIEHPVFKLTTKFRLHVQFKSAPIRKTTPLIVDDEGMQIFNELAVVLRQQGSVVMIYLVACLLERLFGEETIEDIEAVRGDLTIPELIDGSPVYEQLSEANTPDPHYTELPLTANGDETVMHTASPVPLKPTATEWLSSNFSSDLTTSTIFGQPSSNAFGSAPARGSPVSAFSSLSSSPNPFGPNATFGAPVVPAPTQPKSVFATLTDSPSAHVQALPTPSFGTLPSTSSAPEISQQSTSRLPAPSPPFTTSSTSAPSILPSAATTFQVKQTIPRNTGSPLSQMLFSFDSTPSALNPAAAVFTPAFAKPPASSFSDGEDQSFTNAQQLPSTFTQDTHQKSVTTSASPFALAPPTRDGIVVDPASPQPPPAKDLTASASSVPEPISLPSSNQGPTTPAHPSNSVASPESVVPASPLDEPPPLNRRMLISLPSTPTTPLKLALSKSLLDAVRNQELHSSGSPGLLSPLYIPSPSTSPVRTFVSNGTPSASIPDISLSGSVSSSSPTHVSVNGKVKQPARELEKMAVEFARKGFLVKDSFNHWLKRTTDRAAWVEACEHSEASRSQIRVRRRSPVAIPEKSALFHQSPQKRFRRRISSEYRPPRTDEELARRFKENQEEHARRWARESFLQVTRHHIQTKYGSGPANWMVWLSMNPESDGTAIWLECKFNVPASGQWQSESVFSIPLSDRGSTLPSSPGLIVFECTPLEGVMDDLERKFRILDDCGRLRDIIKSFPPRRHYIPSLLLLSWSDDKTHEPESELFTMIVNLVKSSVLGGYRVLFISSSSTNLDEKYEVTLASLPLDMEGKLVQILTLPVLFQLFRSSWVAFSSEWVEKCNVGEDFDWKFYAQILEICVVLLNEIGRVVLDLIDADASFDPLPDIGDIHEVTDSESCYAVAVAWIDDRRYFGSEAVSISKDLLSHRNMGHEFPTTTFFDHLSELARLRLGSRTGTDARTPLSIPKDELAESLQRFQQSQESQAVKLVHTYAMHVRRSPKRRFMSEESSTTTMSSSVSKRRRLSDDTSVRDEPSPMPPTDETAPPSPTTSTASTMPSELITVSMLRALTKDIRTKYISLQ